MTTSSGAGQVGLPARDEWRLTAAEVHPRQSLSGFSVSPDGRHVALVAVRDRRTAEDKERKRIRESPLADVCLLPAEGGYPRPFTSTGNVALPAVWSPDGQRLLLERDGALKTVPVAAGGASKPETVYKGAIYRPRLAPGDAHFGWPQWSPDGRWVLTATREAPETTLLLVSADGTVQRKLLTVEGTLGGWSWSPDGRQVVLVTQHENTWVGDVRLLDVESGAARVLWEEQNAAYQRPVVAWSPDGSRLVFRSNRSGWSKLWVVRTDGDGRWTEDEGREAQPLTTGQWDDSSFRFSPDGKSVVYASRGEQEGSGDDLWTVSLEGGEPARLTRHPGVNVPYGWTADGRVIYWHSSPTEPGDLWSVSVDVRAGSGGAAGEPRRLTWTGAVELERKLRAPEDVTFTGADGQRVHALVYLPADHEEGRTYPPIVWVRGGPTGFSRFDYAPLLSWLANEGFLVITPNYRGSTGHGIAFMEAVAGEGLGKHDLADVLAAGEWVRSHPAADTSRGIGIGGRSWGGYLTLMAVTQAPEVFSCAVAGAAISDWAIQQAQTEMRSYDRWLVGGWVYEQEARTKERSPVINADKVKAPLLVHHGESDRNVPFEQIGPFVEKVRKAGVPVEYVTYPMEGHGNALPRNQQDVLEKTRTFFRRHLQHWNFRDNPTGNQIG